MQQYAQIALLIGALIVGVVLVRWQSAPSPDPGVETSSTSTAELPSMKMLAYIESKIADQEDVKDVRCWSSVNKIQTFLSGLPVELEANSRRIELYVAMIEDVWLECCEATAAESIEQTTLIDVLKTRFPENVKEENGNAKYDFGGRLATIEILEEAIEDYSDTIESWRLLQSWALRKASQINDGNDAQSAAMFSPDSLRQFRDFLVVFDIALLKSAKDVAMERKRGAVDAETMTIAFERLRASDSAPMEAE
jgi:hypothetical protein